MLKIQTKGMDKNKFKSKGIDIAITDTQKALQCKQSNNAFLRYSFLTLAAHQENGFLKTPSSSVAHRYIPIIAAVSKIIF